MTAHLPADKHSKTISAGVGGAFISTKANIMPELFFLNISDVTQHHIA